MRKRFINLFQRPGSFKTSLENPWHSESPIKSIFVVTRKIHLLLLFLAEIEKFEGDELRKDGEVKKYLDVISNKNIKLSERVLIPVQQYPKVRHCLYINQCFTLQ